MWLKCEDCCIWRKSFEKSEEFIRLAPTVTFVSFVILYERSENERKISKPYTETGVCFAIMF
jgi:hypothetical protein